MVFFLQLNLCDPYLSALAVSQLGATFTFTTREYGVLTLPKFHFRIEFVYFFLTTAHGGRF